MTEHMEKIPQWVYTEEQMEKYERFIAEQCGEFEIIFHEIVSPDIHLDIIVVPPTENRPYYQLVTMGMGAYAMPVPEELKQYELERAELILRLPADWNIQSDKEEDFWPIRMLKTVGRIPVQNDTWIGHGHTVSSDAENSPFAENTELCSIALLGGMNQDDDSMPEFRMDGIGKMNFYTLFPIYKEELQIKEEQDMGTLLSLFDEEDLNPVVNITRKNYGTVKL